MSEYTILFYSERVKAAIFELPKGIFATFFRTVQRMKSEGPDLGMPETRAMRGGLFEIRARGTEGWGRVFYCTLKDKKIVMLHGFSKKTNATPPRERKIAERRMQEVNNGTMHPIK